MAYLLYTYQLNEEFQLILFHTIHMSFRLCIHRAEFDVRSPLPICASDCDCDYAHVW